MLQKGLYQVGDSKATRLANMYIWMLTANAPEIWEEFVAKAKFFLDGGITVGHMMACNDPARLFQCLERTVNDMLMDKHHHRSTWQPEKEMLYVIFEMFEVQDWKCMAAFLELEEVIEPV